MGACRSSEGYIDKKNDRRMDDCLRYALVSGKKALQAAGLGMDTDAFKGLNKQRCVSRRAAVSSRADGALPAAACCAAAAWVASPSSRTACSSC